MRRLKRVLTTAKLRTKATSSQLNLDSETRSIAIGRRPGSNTAAYGFIGKVNEQSGGSGILDYAVWLDLDYPHVIGVFGSRGSGKSFDLGVSVECLSGLEAVIDNTTSNPAVIVFDVQNQFWTLGLKPEYRLEEDVDQLSMLDTWGFKADTISNVRIWTPKSSPTFDSYASLFQLSAGQLSEEDWLTTLGLERFSPMGQALLELLSKHPNSLPAELQGLASSGTTLRSFQESTIEGLRWRLAGLAKANLVSEQGLSIEELCEPGAVSILLLRDLPDSMRCLVTGVVSRLLSERLGRFHQETRYARRFDTAPPPENLAKRVWLVVDEAHVLVPSGADTAATEPLIDYVKRGRDAGLSLIFATQQPSAVDSRLMSQVDLTFTHALAFDVDISAAIQRMPTRTSITYQHAGFELPSLGDVIRTLDPGECLVADSASGRVFAMQMRPRLTAHGGNHPA